ncbi:MAG: HAMP domain-containing histidine kinase [Sphingomonadales bacterium]|nr:HAMP domain-containing histidine kinase [Sphingomonadales bacterium]
MNGAAPASQAHAALDADGRILTADEPLLELQAGAGGDPHGPIGIPVIAELVRLVQRLRIPISRAIEVAHREHKISMWVQIRPQGEGISLSIVDWLTHPPRSIPSEVASLRSALAGRAVKGWSWQIDSHLRFRHADQDAQALGHEPPRVGETLTAYFQLDVHGGTAMPLLEGVALRATFRGQVASLRADPAVRYRLSGEPLFDEAGSLMGYSGEAVLIEEETTAPPSDAGDAQLLNLFGPDLGRRLDQALRLPLGRIIANASTISSQLEGPLRQDYVDYASDIAAAGRHLLGLVDDLADLQAIERPDFTTAREEVDLADLARRAAGLLNVKAAAKRIRIQTPPVGERAVARAEYRRVLQILVNLIANAVRHSPEDSTIWVRVDEENGRTRAMVADQGGGIEESDHERIFERFERLGLSGEGSGLGLYISRRLARAMDGDIRVESALGQGARFIVDLPAWGEPSA